jgi:hypothetical protein
MRDGDAAKERVMGWQVLLYSDALNAWMPLGEPAETRDQMERAVMLLRIQRPKRAICAVPFNELDDLVDEVNRLNAGAVPDRAVFYIPRYDDDASDADLPPFPWETYRKRMADKGIRV